MTEMLALETPRLVIRPFVMADLPAVYQLLDIDLADAYMNTEKFHLLSEREAWLRWTVLNYEQLASMYQPPYGDRALVLKSSGELVGSVGFVPCLMPFEQIPGFASCGAPAGPARATTEFGLFYAISPAHRRKGYAAEAAQALIDYAFHTLQLKRVVATTGFDNIGSMGVMRRLGMRIERNPLPEPHYLHVVGWIDNPAGAVQDN